MRDHDPICPARNGTGETYNAKEYDDSNWRECETCGGYGIETIPMPHFEAIKAKAAEIGRPDCYREDLTVHDRHFCEDRDPSLPFLWCARECGTHVVSPEDFATHSYAGGISFLLPDHRLFWWTGKSLVEIDTVREAERRLRDAFGFVTKSPAWICQQAI